MGVEDKIFSYIDYGVFIAMLLVSTGIGVYYAWKERKNTSNRDFLTSTRSLQLFPVAMSLLASFQSSVTILGYPAEMYLRGTQFWLVIISGALAAITAAEIFLPVYYDLRFTSVNKYLLLRFKSEKVRLASSLTFLVGTVPYMGVVLYGPSLALGSVTPLSVNTSIIAIGVICTFYTSIGGIKAVVWTDVVQVFLMFAGLIVVMSRGFYLVGGIDEAFRIAAEGKRLQFFNVAIDPYATNNLWNAVVGMSIMWCGNYCTTQTEVQRYCNVETKKKARIALYINMVGMVFLLSSACLCGVAIFAYYYRCDPLKLNLIQKSDQLMPYFVMDTLSEFRGVPGLFVACVFSASLSTLSSGFNALATITWEDFLQYTPLKNLSDAGTKRLSKCIAAFYGLLTIVMAFLASLVGSVLQAAISLAGALIGPLFGMYSLGMLCPFANATGVLCGLFAGEIFTIWVLVGSLIYPPVLDTLETFTDQCPKNFTAQNLQHNDIFQEPSGILKLYQMAFLLVPVSGFVISLCIGTMASLFTGGFKQISNLDPNLLSPLAWKIWPTTCLPTKKRTKILRDENGLSEVFKGSSNADENLTNNTGEKQESMLGIKGSYKLTNSNDPSCRIMKQTDTTSV